MSVEKYLKMTNFGCYSLVSSAREDGTYERGHYTKTGEFTRLKQQHGI